MHLMHKVDSFIEFEERLRQISLLSAFPLNSSTNEYIKSVLDSVATPTLNASAPAFATSEHPHILKPTVVSTHREQANRLLKLHLPTFSGNPLHWQSF